MTLGVFQSSYYARYSLLGNSLLMYHNVHGEYEELLPSFVQSFLLNRRTITMYIVVIILLFAVTPGQKGVINILAGFPHRRAEESVDTSHWIEARQLYECVL